MIGAIVQRLTIIALIAAATFLNWHEQSAFGVWVLVAVLALIDMPILTIVINNKSGFGGDDV